MCTLNTLNHTESTVATARGLVDMAHFFFDHTTPDEFARLRTSFGFLLNSLSAELATAERDVAALYTEHFATNQNSRQA